MNNLILFAVLSVPIIAVSRHTLFNVKSHGFYRFFSWECIVALLVINYRYWFDNAFSILQVISWILLFVSIYVVTAGAILLKRSGKADENRDDKSLYQFEKTSLLVTNGIFKYIRHPLYSSLLLVTWGICLKHVTTLTLILALLSTVFLYLTALFDEKECIVFFGDKYKEYMKNTKKFIPFIF